MTEFEGSSRRVANRVLIALCLLALAGGLVYWLTRSDSFEGETVFDAGLVEVHAGENKVHHEFVLKNITDQPLSIIAAQATCGCTEYLQPDDIVFPGENLVVPVSLALETSGRKKGGVVLRFDDDSSVNLVMMADGLRVQPIGIAPRPIDLTKRGIRPYMDLEWRKQGRPPNATVTTTNGLEVKAQPWILHAKENSSTGRPAIWRSKLHLTPPDTPGTGTLTVQAGDTPATSVEVIWTELPSSGPPVGPTPVDSAASPSATEASAPAEAPAG
ncbi:MAG: DUF1573 domain-containing protein [Phycisphaerales bacterium]|nr:DUF1573 domain-containing protein [Phycisphaerales bacterium]